MLSIASLIFCFSSSLKTGSMKYFTLPPVHGLSGNLAAFPRRRLGNSPFLVSSAHNILLLSSTSSWLSWCPPGVVNAPTSDNGFHMATNNTNRAKDGILVILHKESCLLRYF